MKCEQKERPYYLPRINVEKDLKCFGMSPVKRDLEWGPDIAILIIDMSPIFVEEILFPELHSQKDIIQP